MQVTVLSSGGMDSTACLAYYLARGNNVRALWVDYGQPAAAAELAAVQRIAAHYGLPLIKLRVEGLQWRLRGGALLEYPGRNLTLAALALNAQVEPGLIALGIHAGSEFADCSEGFIGKLDDLVELLSRGRVRLDCPFLHWAKVDIAQWGWQVGVPYHLTYSCERGSIPPCEECLKCQEATEILRVLNVRC